MKTVTEHIVDWLRVFVAEPDAKISNQQALNTALRQLAKWRSTLIVSTFARHHGLRVLNGPFAGMEYLADVAEGALAARLLGSYESELHACIEAHARDGLDCVIDVGCAEGYYAVGLARLMPRTQIYAYDISEHARTLCASLAERNGVSDRVTIGGEFRPADFEGFRGRRCLVMVDAEGAEDDLLDPAVSPALGGMHLIVETHDVFKPGVRQRLEARFAATHVITVVEQQAKTTPLPRWLQDLGHLDQLLAVWEWRTAPTPWLVMHPR